MGKVAQLSTIVEAVTPVTVTTTCSGESPLSEREEARVREQMRRMHQATVKRARRMQHRVAPSVSGATRLVRTRSRAPRQPRASRPATRPQARATDPPASSDPPGPARSSAGRVANTAACARACSTEGASAIVRAVVVRDESVAEGAVGDRAPLAAREGGESFLDNPTDYLSRSR